MKRILAFMLILSLCLGLAACGQKYDPATDPDLNNTALLTQAAGNSTGTGNTEEKESPKVFDIIGKRAYDYDFIEMTAIEFASHLGLGWNLGNTLDATGGDGINPINQETSWGNPEVTQSLIKSVAEYGYTTIRIPVTWTNFVDQNTYQINESFLNRVKTIVDWSLDEGLFVIINMHHEVDTWLIPTEASYETTSKQLCAMWTQIGTAFAEYDERLIFEAMNEPRTKDGEEWNGNDSTHKIVNKLGLDFVKTIRALGGNNESRFLMVPCYAATSNSNVWAKYEWPDDSRVIMSIHAYLPYNFALNIGGTDQWSNQNKWDTREIDSLIGNIYNTLHKKGHAAVIGEMGCMNKNNNIDARVENVSYYVTRAAFYKIPLCWWDNGAFTDGETFGLINRSTGKATYPEIVAAMFNAWYKADVDFRENNL